MGIDAFGHEEDLVEGDRWKAGEEVFDLFDIRFAGNHKFELKIVVLDPIGDYGWLETGGFVFFGPGRVPLQRGGGVGKLGAERSQITGDPTGWHRGSSLDRDVFAGLFQSGGQGR